MRRSELLLLCVMPVVVCLSTAHAQFSADYQTNIISGVTSNWTGNYIVGSNTVFDLLRIENGGVLVDSDLYSNGYIGYEPSASNNFVVVSGNSSVWSNNSVTYVGRSGSGNSLVASNGGVVTSLAGWVGLNGGANNNTAVVTGNGSVWRNAYNLSIGDQGSGNSLVISDGGVVIDETSGGQVGGSVSPASNNTALVTGIGSIWSNNTSSVSVGVMGLGNSLVISNGGVVVNMDGSLGWDPTASNNAVTVIGNGATWRNQGRLSVLGGGNQLTISAGGVVVASNVTINGSQWTTANAINILGGSLCVSNGRVSVGNGVAYGGVAQMTISNGTVLAREIALAEFSGSQGRLTIAGGTITVLDNGTMTIGSQGCGDLIISDGFVSTPRLQVAANASSVGTLHLDGGTLLVTSHMWFGHQPGATAHAWVTGGQLIATNGYQELHVGSSCPTQMTISNGSVESFYFHLGDGNVGTLTVAGGQLSAGPIWVADTTNASVWVVGGQINAGGFYVGAGADGTATISNGAVSIPLIKVGWRAGGAGTLTIAGGTVDFNSPYPQFPEIISEFHIGGRSEVTGVVWVTGGQLVGANTLYVGGTNDIGFPPNQSGFGQMTVSNGTVDTGKLMVGALTKEVGCLKIVGGEVLSGGLSIGTPNCNGTGTVTVTGGSLFVTNAAHDAVLEILSGTFTVSGGNCVIDKLVITNACGRFIHSGGNLVVGTLVLDPTMDADGDGLPNAWEQNHGLDPLRPDAADDPDGDGLSNAQEFALGTDPTDRSSPYHITAIVQEDVDIRVAWMSVGGKTNFMQATADLSSNFTDFSSAIVISGAGVTSTNYLDLGAVTNSPARFYRVRLVP